MKKLICFFFVLLFGCNTTNFNTAYKDYYKNQRIYINAILDNNKQSKINALRELIKCGKYMHFNVDDYKYKLQKLLKHSKKTIRKTTPKTYKSKIYLHSFKYIRIVSFNPLKIQTDKQYKIYSLNTKKLYEKIIDIYNAIYSKNITHKTFDNIKLTIAQYKPNIVRIVYYSKSPIRLYLKKEKKYLIFYIKNRKNTPLIKKTLKQPKKISVVLKKRRIIVLDPGHGGKDSGGIGLKGREEKMAVLRIARYVKYYLTKAGYTVYLTRDKDIFRPLKWRTHFANAHHADLFISIHCNIVPSHEYGPHGVETYYLSPTRSARAIRVAKLENKGVKGLNYLDQRVILGFLNKDRIISSDKFAIDVQSNILHDLRKRYKNVTDGGVRPAPFWVLVGTEMPAILIETGFLTNPIESKRLFTPAYQKLLAKGIADGINAYFIKNSK